MSSQTSFVLQCDINIQLYGSHENAPFYENFMALSAKKIPDPCSIVTNYAQLYCCLEYNWPNSYLCNCTELCNSNLSNITFDCDVPQGSCSRPLIFFCILELPRYENRHVSMSLDDSTTYSSNSCAGSTTIPCFLLMRVT